ncbi:trem-like transcript 4 protein [Suricata suricatta]|uniref:trem-like transcript 4 protein n=1 Tax=Suricata suricatta TaxID=37032 RepID=UPI0011552D82|nr:trem-like transcript 4 protein [Suricata suricatta]
MAVRTRAMAGTRHTGEPETEDLPAGQPYKENPVSADICTRVCQTSLSSRPWLAGRDSSHTVWGGLHAGFFTTRIQLREEDSVPHWYGSYNSVTVLRIINLLVSPAPTTAVWTPTWLLPSTVLITSPEGTSYSPSSLNGSEFSHEL